MSERTLRGFPDESTVQMAIRIAEAAHLSTLGEVIDALRTRVLNAEALADARKQMARSASVGETEGKTKGGEG